MNEKNTSIMDESITTEDTKSHEQNNLCYECENENMYAELDPNRTISVIIPNQGEDIALLTFGGVDIAVAVAGAIASAAVERIKNEYFGPDVVAIHASSISEISSYLKAQLSNDWRNYFERKVEANVDLLKQYNDNPGRNSYLLDHIIINMTETSFQLEALGVGAICAWVQSVNLVLSAYVLKEDDVTGKPLAARRAEEGRGLLDEARRHTHNRVDNSCRCEREYDGSHGYRWHCKFTADGRKYENATHRADSATRTCRRRRLDKREEIKNRVNREVLNGLEIAIQKWESYSK